MKKNIFIAFFLLLALSAFAQKKASKKANRVIIPEANLEFKANDDYTEVTITGFKWDYEEREKFEGKTLEVPSTIQGVPVTAIVVQENYGSVFGEINSDIYVPDSVKFISPNAFSRLKGNTVRLPEGLEIISSGTFSESKITNISIPSSVKIIEDKAFDYCKNLETLTIPATVEKICSRDDYSYDEWREIGIRKLVFEGELIYIDSNFYIKADNLEQIEFPKNFTVISCKEGTLADIIRGEKIKSNFALQKKLKGIKIQTADAYFESKYLPAYEAALNEGKSDEALGIIEKAISHSCFNEYIHRSYKYKWLIRKHEIIDKPILEAYEKAFESGDYQTALQVAKEKLSELEKEMPGYYAYHSVTLKTFKAWRERIAQAQIAYIVPPFVKDLLSKKGELKEESGNLIFELPFDKAHISFYDSEGKEIKDAAGNSISWTNIVYEELKKQTGLEFGIYRPSYYSSNQNLRIYREATPEEKAAHEAQKKAEEQAKLRAKQLKDFEEGKINTNLGYRYYSGSTLYQTIEFSEKKGEIYVSGIEKERIFANQGFQKKDVIKKLTLTAEDGSITEIPLQELTDNSRLLKIPAPATLEFTIQRGKGKKAETLTIKVPVEWGVR